VTHGWTYAQTAAHTWPQLLNEIRRDRADRGEPEDGATASDREIRRYLREFRHDR
jgi:hypothetical protein